MIFQRYADPFLLLNGMITAGRFAEYIHEFLQIYNEDQEEKTLWELWLHKVHDKSYTDFKASVGMITKNAAPTKKETAEVVQQSKQLLAGFRIGVGGDGIIQTVGNSSD